METLLISISIATTAALGLRVLKRKKQRNVRRYLAQIETLKNLIVLLQAYRDTSANLAHAKLVSIEQSPRFMRDQIIELIEVLSDKQLLTNERWIGFIDHWQRLDTSPLKSDPGYGFIQHTSLIVNLLPLIEELAEEYGFTRHKLELFPNITLMWRELPLLIEYTAQARSLALTIANRPVLTKGDLAQLQNINRKLRKLSRVIFHHIRYNGSPTEEREQVLQQATRHCLAFTVTLDAQLSGSTTMLNKETLSAHADASIKGSQRLLDIEYQQILTQLEAG